MAKSSRGFAPSCGEVRRYLSLEIYKDVAPGKDKCVTFYNQEIIKIEETIGVLSKDPGFEHFRQETIQAREKICR